MELLKDLKKTLFSEKYRVTTNILIIAIIFLFFIHPFISIFLVVGYLGYIQGRVHAKFMEDFAKEHGFSYSTTVNIKEIKARLFQIGHSRIASNIISGEYEKFPRKIFNYRYTVGSGKNSHTYQFTVCEIEVTETEFPHIFLKSDSMRRYGSKDLFGQDKDVRIKLDAEVEDSFNLYCTQDYEIETLQIFTKEMLKDLKEANDKISIEFVDNKIYFYDDRIIREKDDLTYLLNLVKKVIDNSGGLLRRLSDDFRSMHEVYKKD